MKSFKQFSSREQLLNNEISATEQELMELVGAGDANPETTPSSWPCIAATIKVTVSVCPTSSCTSRC